MPQPRTADKLCRACATFVEERSQEEAFRQFQKFQKLYSTLSELTVYDDDDLPKLLCPTCVAICQSILETIENFKEACTKSADSIRKLIIANLKEEPMQEIVSAEMLEPILKTENEENEKPKFAEHPGVAEPKLKSTRVTKLPAGVRPVCALCGVSFVNMKGIRKHMLLELKRRSESKDLVKTKSVREVSEILNCTYEGCLRTFVNNKCLMQHLNKHANSPTASCTPCNKSFLTFAHYRRHLKSCSNTPKTPPLTCATCGESFNTAHRLKQHKLKLHPEEPKWLPCRFCSARFVLEIELEAHKINDHPSVRLYFCHHCGRSRSSKETILNHIVTEHTETELDYESCSICRAKVRKAKLNHHYVSTHTVRSDVEVIKCQICNKQFKQKCLLRKHMKSHTGERPFVCDQCGMAFTRMHTLKKHHYTHSGQRPVHCDYCGKGMYSKHALKIHMNIHKKEWIAQGQTGIELMVYATSNKSKYSTEKKYANLKHPSQP